MGQMAIHLMGLLFMTAGPLVNLLLIPLFGWPLSPLILQLIYFPAHVNVLQSGVIAKVVGINLQSHYKFSRNVIP